MGKVAIKYLLIFSALIFMSSGKLIAGSFHPIKSLQQAGQVYAVKGETSSVVKNSVYLNQDFVIASSKSESEEVDVLLIENEEEDDVVSHKKQFAACAYFIQILYGNSISFYKNSNVAPFSGNTGTSADSHLYLQIQVIRI